jgi:hypothetical protein
MKLNSLTHMETIYILVHIQYSIEGEGAGLIINFVTYIF